MKEYIKFILDFRLLVVIIVLFLFEFCLQMGMYKPFLKKNSYAANVNRITKHALDSKDVLDPDILILGTSVAFEGLSVRILNEKLNSTGYKVQTLAIPGSELVVQHQVLKENILKFPNLIAIIHVMEPGMPWVDRDELILPTLAMLSEVNHFDAIRTIDEFEYKYNWQDISYLLFKSIAYRRDLNDFLSEPQERIKFMGREMRSPNLNPWDYDNKHTESISAYGINNLEECLKKVNPANNQPIPFGSDKRHKKMLYDTCTLSMVTTLENNETPRTQRYFRRLSKMYGLIPKDKIKVIHVFAPYSEIISNFGRESRRPLWEKELNHVTKSILGYDKAEIINLENLLDGADNGKYCFDLIHLNQFGTEKFSNKLGEVLLKRFPKKIEIK